MGVSTQQWRATIGQWGGGRPGKCVITASAIARKPQQDIHKWFRFLVLVSLLVIGCVELNPGPTNVKVSSRTLLCSYASSTENNKECRLDGTTMN
jgi:hypothetical protein